MAGFLVVGVGLVWVDRVLQHGDANGGALALEFAPNHEEVAAIVGPWAEAGHLHIAGFGLGVDMAYLVFYGLLLSALAAGVALRARAGGVDRLATTAAAAGYVAWVAAGLDVLENAFTVPLLAADDAGIPAAVTVFAAAKFFGLAFVIATLVYGGFRTRRSFVSRRRG